MLELQKLLRSKGGIEALNELSIRVYEHPTLPLNGYKYCQINSPRNHPVVLDCRGVVLERDTWNLVAKPFTRFFNVGEFPDNDNLFDWWNYKAIEKCDGSLVIVYYYGGQWHANTSGSFGLGDGPNGYNGNWRDLFWNTAKFVPEEVLDINTTYIFELCTPYNMVVKRYSMPCVFLIGASTIGSAENGHYVEFDQNKLDKIAQTIGPDILRPSVHQCASRGAYKELIQKAEIADEIDEGFILLDRAGRRLKAKTDRYKLHHHLLDNGNLFKGSNLLNVWLRGEHHEVMTTRPETKGAFDDIQGAFGSAVGLVEFLFRMGTVAANAHANPKDAQKAFAMAVGQEKWAPVLFHLRKWGIQNDVAEIRFELRQLFVQNPERYAIFMGLPDFYQPTY